MQDNALSRRAFLAASAGAVAAALPCRAPAQMVTADRVLTGHIGLGEQGRTLLQRCRGLAAAVCDVDEDRLAQGAAIVGAGVRVFKDYRELLEQSDIAAVVIATPDHWHAYQAVHACEAGKDVYIETPVCRSPAEAVALTRAAKWYGGIVHAGGASCLSAAGSALKARLAEGAIGTVHRILCWGDANPAGGDPALDGPAPARLDWDRWLGPSRWALYNPDRFSGWRWLLDYGGGNIARQGAELITLAAWAVGFPDSSSFRVTAQGQPPEAGLWDCPRTLEASIVFDAQDLSITWRQPGEGGGAGMVVEGESGSIRVTWDGQWSIEGETGGSDEDPFDAWLTALHDRSGAAAAVALYAQAASMACLANLSYRLGRPLTWGITAGKVIGDEQADRMLRAPGRGPYRL